MGHASDAQRDRLDGGTLRGPSTGPPAADRGLGWLSARRVAGIVVTRSESRRKNASGRCLGGSGWLAADRGRVGWVAGPVGLGRAAARGPE